MRSFNVETTNRIRTGAMGRLLLTAACGLAMAWPGHVGAAVTVLNAAQDPTEVSSFTLDFGEFGGPRSANISSTRYTMVLDVGVPGGPAAAFTSYFQQVDELFLPNPAGPGEPDIGTGAITISLDQSLGGTYDPATGFVTTNDVYRIEFDGDLSGLGIFSPVFLEGESAGVIDFATAKTGTVALNWEGNHTIGGLTFGYVCATNVVFGPRIQRIQASEVSDNAGTASTASTPDTWLNAAQDPAEVSSFTLDFGEFGGPRTANISSTAYTMVLDMDAPGGPTAAFTSYAQHVDELFLPNPAGPGEPDIGTGAITISLEESLGGTYDPVTGFVATNDVYRIEFDGDLSGLGIFSPVLLEGESAGVIVFATAKTGSVALNWAGDHTIGGLTFGYVCATNVVFGPRVSRVNTVANPN